MHLKGCLSINLVLVVVLLLDGEDFLILEEDVFVPVLWRRRSALVCRIAFKAGVRMCPFERQCTLVCRSSLMRHHIDWVDMVGSQDMILCFKSGFQRIRSCTVFIVA